MINPDSASAAAFDLQPIWSDVFTLWDKGHLTDELLPKEGLTLGDVNDCLENESGYGQYASLNELRRDCKIVAAMALAGANASAVS